MLNVFHHIATYNYNFVNAPLHNIKIQMHLPHVLTLITHSWCSVRHDVNMAYTVVLWC